MLPLMIVTGFILQRPLDRAMKRWLQAESAARHGVLVETLSGLEAIHCHRRKTRMQTPGNVRSRLPRGPVRMCTSGPRYH